MNVKLTIWMIDPPMDIFRPQEDSPKMTKLRARLHDVFAGYKPKRVTTNPKKTFEFGQHEITMTPDDPAVERLLKSFGGEVRRAKAVGRYTVSLTGDETKRARFLPLKTLGDPVESAADDYSLNVFTRVLCDVCKYPDIAAVPKPLLLNRQAMKKQDVFDAGPLLVVRRRVLDLLKSAIGDQIESGDAQLAGETGQPRESDRLYWVRPVATTAGEPARKVNRRCNACGRPLEIRALGGKMSEGIGLRDGRRYLNRFGDDSADLALVEDGFFGTVNERGDGRTRWFWQYAISGALFSYLKDNGVTGIKPDAFPEPNQCYFSEAGEATLEPEPRTFGAAPPTAESPPAAVRRGAATSNPAYKDVPWDYDEDGYVYFHLSSPELVVLDPMTWEQDAGGPYRVKRYKKPGLYRMHVSAIRAADGKDDRGVAVDIATLLLVDNAAFAALQDAYDWDKAHTSRGGYRRDYHDRLATAIGSRFAICTVPPKRLKSEFIGDGEYVIDAAQIEFFK